MRENELDHLVRADPWMMRVLQAAEQMSLPDWWIGAGFLRNAVWDHLSGRAPRHDADVDLVYFDAVDARAERDWELEERAKVRFPFAEWEIRNQARMHKLDGQSPYRSTAEGISHWVETATCVAVRLTGRDLEFLYCHGSADLLGMVARPVPTLDNPDGLALFTARIRNKRWQERWPGLDVIVPERSEAEDQ